MTDLRRAIAAGSLALVLCLSSLRLLFPLSAAGYDDRIPALADAVIAEQSGGDLHQWLTETLPAQAGQSDADWYAAVLAAYDGCDLSAYTGALQNYIAENNAVSGSTRERLALTLAACSPEPPAVCSELLDSSAGTLGIMSWVFALHLMNNDVPSARYSRSEIAETLISQQTPDGGWSISGDRGDADVTAMTLQALAPYRDTAAVSQAIERGIDFLADTQLSDGAFQSWGTENAESTAQVWIALSALGIDALSDDRFIQNGCTLLDGIMQFQVSDGSYAHTIGGDANRLATVQVFLALRAAQKQQQGENLLLFYGMPEWDGAPDVTEPAATEKAAGKANPVQEPAKSNDKKTETTAGTTGEATASAAKTTASEQTGTTASRTETTANPQTAVTTVRADAAEIVMTTKPPADPRSDNEKYPYRIPLTAAACVIFGGAAVFFLLRKNRSPKTYLTLGGGLLVVTALIWCIKIESPAQFYQNEAHSGGGNVTMSIRCDVICGMDGSEQFPADGIIMPLTEFSITEDENALELLYDAVKTYALQLEVDGVSGEAVETAYVRGIASLYEFDFGDLSGWTYEVNGERPAVGCGACILHDGDRVEWIYTVNL